MTTSGRPDLDDLARATGAAEAENARLVRAPAEAEYENEQLRAGLKTRTVFGQAQAC